MEITREFDSALSSLSGGSADGHRYLLGVSGGIDSMCMARLFLDSSLHPDFAIAHVNFSLRGEESDGDMDSVVEWGRANGIQVFTRTFDTNAYSAENSISTQMAARELRYGFFSELMDSEGFDLLAIAHNLDDSIETIFLNIARGTGLKGLSGIPVRNGRIIRPLMGISRARIREYVESNGVSYRDDRTNFESHYARNRVRNIIFPEFRKINPSFLNTVRRDAEYFREASDIIDGVYAGVCSRVCSTSGDGVLTIGIQALLQEGHCGYWLNMMLREYGFNSGQVSDGAHHRPARSVQFQGNEVPPRFLSPSGSLQPCLRRLRALFCGGQPEYAPDLPRMEAGGPFPSLRHAERLQETQ